jgi:hypothetical protein
MPVQSDTDRVTGWRTRELNGSDLVTLLMGIGVLGLVGPGIRAALLHGVDRVPFAVRWNSASQFPPTWTA